MAISSSITLGFLLVGDGSSTTFSFDIDKLYGSYIAAAPCSLGSFVVLNSTVVPDSVSVGSVRNTDCTGTGITGSGTISRRTITLTFSSAPSGEVLVEVGL